MHRIWLVALTCSACLATPLAHAQAQATTKGAAPASGHATMSPIGRAMAALLDQSAGPPASAGVASNVAASDAMPATHAAASADAATAAPASSTGARTAGEIAVQPPR